MKFPNRELAIVQLGADMARGMTAHADVFPAPPASAESIDEALAAYHTARESSLTAQATAQAGSAAKKEALEALAAMLRSNVKYAESMTHGDTGRLQLVGWGGRRKPIRNERTAPGQVITLAVGQEGAGWVALGWKAPFDGGTVSAYRIQRRKRDNGSWADVGHWLNSVFFGTSMLQALLLISMALLIPALPVLACFWPARHVTQAD